MHSGCSARHWLIARSFWDGPSGRSGLRKKLLESGKPDDPGFLKNIIEVIEMQEDVAVMKKYYSEEAWERSVGRLVAGVRMARIAPLAFEVRKGR